MASGISTQAVFKWLYRVRLMGRQHYRGAPWKISLRGEQINLLATLVRRTGHSTKEAS